MNSIVQVQRQLRSEPGWRREFPAGLFAAKSIRPLTYVLLSLVPSATLMAGWMRFHGPAEWFGVAAEGVLAMAVALWVGQLAMVPLLLRLARVVGRRPAPGAAHYQVEFLEAFAPPVLMMTPLSLMVSALSVFAVAAAFAAAGMMLFIGRYSDRDAGPAFTGLSWRVVELGFVGWAAVMLLVTIV
jgi:hypothetical protein